jgi:hypothetical protein
MTIKSIEWDGRKITKPGLYSKLSLELYHNPDICDGPSVSSSMLRKMNPDVGSMAHFYASWSGNPEADDPEESRAMIVGRAVHHLLLGEPFFAKIFCVQPKEYVNKTTGEAKEWNNNATVCREWQAARAKEGRTVLTAKEVDSIRRMSASVSKHPHARHWLSGQIERSFFWKDKETGVWLKWRPDAIPTADLDFCDLKTTESVLWPDLMRTVRKYAYYQQAALGRTACREVLGRDMHSFTLLFIEKKGANCTRDVRFDDRDIDRGDHINRACLHRFVECLKTGSWPGPGAGNEGNERIRLSDETRASINQRVANEIGEPRR